MTPDELPAYWARIRQKVAEEGPRAAAYAMARTFHGEVVGVELMMSSHSRGTRTPAPPGGPPAAVTGSLRRSVRLYPAVATGAYRAKSSVAPLIVYARIQELGGTVHSKHTFVNRHGRVEQGYLAWGPTGARHFAKSVTLPARPYMRPVHRRLVADGRLRNAARDAVRGLVP